MSLDIHKHMVAAIDEGKQSKSEDERIHPNVGVVVVKDGKVIGQAHRGELASGDHAEFTALERKLPDADLTGSSLITTLEPCTSRNHPKSPCARRLINRRIAKVYIGMRDPNPDVYGKCILVLRESGIEVEMFPQDLAVEVRKDNAKFIELHIKPQSTDPKKRSLNSWYYTINSIYFDSNFYRDAGSLFTHLVEIMGGLSLLATKKVKAEVNTEKYMAKAVAWWLALCGRVGLRSVEDLLWYKFPFVCPYCRRAEHNDDACREEKKKNKNPDWRSLNLIGLDSIGRRPTSLGGWQKMFGSIYGAGQTEQYNVIFGRFTEELGELAEAIRVGTVVPGYFLSEAADVFAWLMKLINIFEADRGISPGNRGARLEELMYEQYPDKCLECGRSICACPPILGKTLGRIAHDGPEPTLLEEARPFLSPTESAALFEIGSAQIVIGPERFQVTRDLAAEVARFVEHMSKALTSGVPLDADSRHQFEAVLIQMGNVAKIGRVNDRHIQNFLRMVELLDERGPGILARLFESAGKSAFVEALRNRVRTNEEKKQ